MTTRAGIEVMCDSHPGEPRAIARLTDFRHEPWPASSPDHAVLCAQLLPGRAVTPPPEPVYGIAVTYLTHLRNERGE